MNVIRNFRIICCFGLLSVIELGGDHLGVLGHDVSDEEQRVAEFMKKSSRIFGEVLYKTDQILWEYAINASSLETYENAKKSGDEYDIVFAEQTAELMGLLEHYPDYKDEELAYLVRVFLVCSPGTFSETGEEDVLGGYEGKDMYTDMVKLWQLAAEKQGYAGAVELNMFNNFLDPDTTYDDMLSLWEETKEYYEELFYYVNHKMSEIHKDNYTLSETGLAPMEFFGGWPKDFSFKAKQLNPFYSSESRIKLEEHFKECEYTPLQFAQYSEDLLVSMGFQELHKSFWKNSYFEEGENTLCFDYMYHLADEKMYVGMCADQEISRLQDVYNFVGISHHYLEEDLAGIHNMMKTVYFTGWMSYIADSISPSLLSPAYLAQIEVLPEGGINKDTTMYYLFREYLEVIPRMANAIAFQLWLWSTYSGEITEENYNCELYKIIAQVQGMKPPYPRSTESFDIITSDTFLDYGTFTGFFFGNIVKYQIFMEMCKAGGHEGNLHECNLHGYEDAGMILKGLMQTGSTIPYRQLFQDVMQKPIFDTTGIKEYLRPVFEWIKAYNDENECRLPWDHQGVEDLLCKTYCENNAE